MERTTLRCPRCGGNTDHALGYAGRLLVRSTCTRCGHTIQRDVRRRYLTDLGHRIRSKPRRMVRRLSRHPLAFTVSLPLSTAAKPLRLLREVDLVLHAAAGANRAVRSDGGR